jgi:hypothetical protein
VENVSLSSVANGGIYYLANVTNVIVVNGKFINSGGAANGGIFYLNECGRVTFDNSIFERSCSTPDFNETVEGGAKALLCEYRSFEEKFQSVGEVELEVDFLKNEKMFLVTEGEKRIRSYRILSEDEGVSPGGHVEFIIKNNNSQEVHPGEGIYQAICLASLSVREEYSEAGANTHLENIKTMESVQKDDPIIGNSQTNEENLVMYCHYNALVKFTGAQGLLKPREMSKSLLCKYRSLEEEIQAINNVELEINFLICNRMFLVSEGERRI